MTMDSFQSVLSVAVQKDTPEKRCSIPMFVLDKPEAGLYNEFENNFLEDCMLIVDVMEKIAK